MSDKLYSRGLSGGQDIELWQMGFSPNDPSIRPQRRITSNSERNPTFDESLNLSLNMKNSLNKNKDISEPEMKFAVLITESVNILSQHIITHPFVVIRRQTQVNRKSLSYHLIPLTVIPFMIKIQSKQGFGVLFKGITSVFITKAMLIGIETIIGELTPFVRDISSKRLSVQTIVNHLLLKGMAFLLITPFLCSSCIETVQSSIASENPGVFDSLREGLSRIGHWKMDRKLPIWVLCGPTLTYHLSHYIIYSLIKKFSLSIRKNKNNENENNNNWSNRYQNIMDSFWGHLIADVLLYPLETVIYRLYLQGTRTIIDDVHQSNAVTPIITDYDSTSDCFTTIIKEEGKLGLFKGIGALVLQYSVHYTLIRLTKYCLQKTIANLK